MADVPMWLLLDKAAPNPSEERRVQWCRPDCNIVMCHAWQHDLQKIGRRYRKPSRFKGHASTTSKACSTRALLEALVR